MALLPVTKREMVRARFLLVLSVEALQVLVCVPFMLLRASYGSVKNAVGIEANAAFLGLSLVLLGLFNRIFFPMHYKNAYDLGKAVPAFEHRTGSGCSRPGDASAHPSLPERRLRQLCSCRSAAPDSGAARRTSGVLSSDRTQLHPKRPPL